MLTIALYQQPCKRSQASCAENEDHLNWDCNIENNAFLRNCNKSVEIPQDFSEISETINLNGENCNINTVTTTLLQKLWDEVKNEDLTDPKYNDATIKNFGIMANGPTTGFACTYNKCSGKLLCLYNKAFVSRIHSSTYYSELQTVVEKGRRGFPPCFCPTGPLPREVQQTIRAPWFRPLPQKTQALYKSGNTCVNDPCAQGSSCENYLCKLAQYTPATNTYPIPLCSPQKNDGMTYEMQMSVLNLANYYRRLLGSGWAQDKNGYAPIARRLYALTYNCDLLGHFAKQIADKCGDPPYTPYARNWVLTHHKINDVNIDQKAALEEVMMAQRIS
ncbi:hypothetical protein Y032_0256g364 [Ancylostoma ceylanicum]|uniref:SCP domain-containing protein n=1 Tax=Ancylostoma ceylanicum TaxID=53326 RepID=A0A016SAY7_9BILA|nr:hypothetical protein Y032_0256g364 [Ancylostoma ceylanicum]